MVMTNLDWSWLAFPRVDQPWPALTSFDWSWTPLTDVDQSLQALAGLDWPWWVFTFFFFTRFDPAWLALTGSIWSRSCCFLPNQAPGTQGLHNTVGVDGGEQNGEGAPGRAHWWGYTRRALEITSSCRWRNRPCGCGLNYQSRWQWREAKIPAWQE